VSSKLVTCSAVAGLGFLKLLHGADAVSWIVNVSVGAQMSVLL
jgi:hypothetical protein